MWSDITWRHSSFQVGSPLIVAVLLDTVKVRQIRKVVIVANVVNEGYTTFTKNQFSTVHSISKVGTWKL